MAKFIVKYIGVVLYWAMVRKYEKRMEALRAESIRLQKEIMEAMNSGNVEGLMLMEQLITNSRLVDQQVVEVLQAQQRWVDLRHRVAMKILRIEYWIRLICWSPVILMEWLFGKK